MMENNKDPHANEPAWMEKLAQNPKQTAYGLFVLGGLLAIVPLWVGIKYRSDYVWICGPTAILALIPIAGGLWQLLRPRGTGEPRVLGPGEMADKDAVRILALAVGGLCGLGLVATSTVLASYWWDTILGGTKEWRGANGWQVWLTLLVFLFGLALMFASLQLGRTEERTNPWLRRLLYGYNAVLTGLLLLAILGVVNVLAASQLTTTYDWSRQSIYSLSSQSENILRDLKKPTKIYVILARGEDPTTYRRVHALLDNCRSFTDKLQVEYFSPDLDKDRVNQLRKDHHFSDREGILVLYGTEPNVESQFIKRDALYGMASFRRARENQLFQGESELMSALKAMEEGKEKPVLYFTQGNGELDINDNISRDLDSRGGGELKQRLETANYTVKPLKFAALGGQTKVPEDASIVVVAGPQFAFPEAVSAALREYMEPKGADAKKKKGRLIVLLDYPPGNATSWPGKGLENFLANVNVEATQTRILSTLDDPYVVIGLANPEEDYRKRNPIASAFYRQGFTFYKVREIRPKPNNNPESFRYKAEPLLLVLPGLQGVVYLTDSTLRSPGEIPQKDLKNMVAQEALPIAVTVTEGASMDPHGFGTTSDSNPRMVVFGCAQSFSNALLARRGAGPKYDLVASFLAWLREKPGSIGIEAKKEDMFILNAAEVNTSRMLWMPTLLMLLTIIGLGTGVWLVRRK